MATTFGNPIKDRSAPSGPTSAIKGIMVIAATAVALTAVATQTGVFPSAFDPNTDDVADIHEHDLVTLAPQANLNGSLAIAWARVVTDNVICVAFSNIGASTNTGTITFDVAVSIQHQRVIST